MLRGSHKTMVKTLERIVKKYNCELDVTVISSDSKIGNPEYYFERYDQARRGCFDYNLKTLLSDRIYLIFQDRILRFILIDDRLDYLDAKWSKIIEKELADAKNYWDSVKEEQEKEYWESLGYQY